MATEPDIKVTKRLAKEQATALEEQAKALRRSANTLKTYRLEKVEEKWDDPVAKKYLRQVKLTMESLNESAAYLERIAASMVSVAEKLTF